MLSTTPESGGPSRRSAGPSAARRCRGHPGKDPRATVVGVDTAAAQEQVPFRFLDDIKADVSSKDYSLQPLIVKRLSPQPPRFINGRQRLTTLYLILRYMQTEGFKKSGPPFSIAYARG